MEGVTSAREPTHLNDLNVLYTASCKWVKHEER